MKDKLGMIPDIVSMKLELTLANGEVDVEATPTVGDTLEAPEVRLETPPLVLTNAA